MISASLMDSFGDVIPNNETVPRNFESTSIGDSGLQYI